MATIHPRTFACEACHAPVEAKVASSVNAERDPHLRQAVLRRIFHLFVCSACGAPTKIETEFLYIDMGRGQFFGIYPPEAMARARVCAMAVVSAFEGALGESASGPARDLGRGFQVRVCFGLEELREKILCAEEGLDDLTLEALKVEVLGMRPELAELGIQTLRLDSVEPETKTLMFLLEQAGEPPRIELGRLIEVERAVYDAVDRPWRETLAARPYLASGPWVSLLGALDFQPDGRSPQ